MAEEASVGLMVWDGKSVGTLTNVLRLVRRHKKVVIYIVPSKQFWTLRDESDWNRLLSQYGRDTRRFIEEYGRSDEWKSTNAKQARLF